MRPVGFDNTFLSILLNPSGNIPSDPTTGKPVVMAKRRAEFLVDTLGKTRQRIVIPTPAAAELLTAIGPTAQQYFDIVAKSRLFEVASFDIRCAIELAYLNRSVFADSDQRNRAEAYQKIKIDRQILAIFRVAGVETIYTDDVGLARRARLCNMTPVMTAELELPETERQLKITFEGNDDIPEPSDDLDC